MCGLVGFIGTAGMNDLKAFKQLLFVDTLRGGHATGIIAVDDKSFGYQKRALSAPDFLSIDKYDITSVGDRAILGHNRYATQGSSTDDNNAHPFAFDNIVGMHNGTLRTRNGLPAPFETVDSKQLLASIDAAADPIDILTKVEGAYALVWYDKRSDSVFITRNSERPLFIATTNGGDRFYASEKAMLDLCLPRNTINNYTVEELPVGVLVQYKLGANVVETRREYTPKANVVVYAGNPRSGTGYYQGANYSSCALTDLGLSKGQVVPFLCTEAELSVVGNKAVYKLTGSVDGEKCTLYQIPKESAHHGVHEVAVRSAWVDLKGEYTVYADHVRFISKKCALCDEPFCLDPNEDVTVNNNHAYHTVCAAFTSTALEY